MSSCYPGKRGTETQMLHAWWRKLREDGADRREDAALEDWSDDTRAKGCLEHQK